MMKLSKYLIFLLMPVLAGPAARAAGDYAVVELGSFDARKEAASFARAASAKLHYSIAVESLKSPPSHPGYFGLVVSVWVDGKKFKVTSFTGGGESTTSKQAFADAKKVFPKAYEYRTNLAAIDLNMDYAAMVFEDVLILGSFKTFEEAKAQALKVSEATQVPYYTRGLEYRKGALVWPSEHGDEDEEYFVRRYNHDCGKDKDPPCITVELSGAYSGFTEGLFILVGGIGNRGDLPRFKKAVPDAYFKRTQLYMGCMH